MAGGSQGAGAPTGYADGGYLQGGYGQQSPLGGALPSTQFMGGPDSGADYAPANMGFDNSGSDGGVGGQPAPMMTPLSGGSRGFAFGGPTQPMGGFGTQPASSPTMNTPGSGFGATTVGSFGTQPAFSPSMGFGAKPADGFGIQQPLLIGPAGPQGGSDVQYQQPLLIGPAGPQGGSDVQYQQPLLIGPAGPTGGFDPNIPAPHGSMGPAPRQGSDSFNQQNLGAMGGQAKFFAGTPVTTSQGPQMTTGGNMNPQMPANFQKGVQPAYAGPQMMTNGPMAQPTPMQRPMPVSTQPAPMGNKPLGLAQFQRPKGVQIKGNPTSQVVQRPRQR